MTTSSPGRTSAGRRLAGVNRQLSVESPRVSLLAPGRPGASRRLVRGQRAARPLRYATFPLSLLIVLAPSFDVARRLRKFRPAYLRHRLGADIRHVWGVPFKAPHWVKVLGHCGG